MKDFSLFRIAITLVLIFILFLLSPFQINSNDNLSIENEEYYRAIVKEVSSPKPSEMQKVKVMIKEGKYKGKEFVVDNTLTLNDNLLCLKANDEVLLLIQGDNNNLTVTIQQYIREKKIFYLFLFFIILILIIGGIKGLYAISSIIFTVSVISLLLIPGLLRGNNPVLLTIICSLIISFFSLLIQNGINKKTFSSFIGTLSGVIISGIITLIMSNSLQISINSEDFIHLSQVSQDIKFNFQAILFSSIVIGALGANIDMSMSVATAMNEVKESNNHISKKNLIACGMSVGRDVIGTMSNTLILAYVGSSLVSLMIFTAYKVNFMYIINLEDISIEILKSLAGSIGIILSVPITVFVRAYME